MGKDSDRDRRRSNRDKEARPERDASADAAREEDSRTPRSYRRQRREHDDNKEKSERRSASGRRSEKNSRESHDGDSKRDRSKEKEEPEKRRDNSAKREKSARRSRDSDELSKEIEKSGVDNSGRKQTHQSDDEERERCEEGVETDHPSPDQVREVVRAMLKERVNAMADSRETHTDSNTDENMEENEDSNMDTDEPSTEVEHKRLKHSHIEPADAEEQETDRPLTAERQNDSGTIDHWAPRARAESVESTRTAATTGSTSTWGVGVQREITPSLMTPLCEMLIEEDPEPMGDEPSGGEQQMEGDAVVAATTVEQARKTKKQKNDRLPAKTPIDYLSCYDTLHPFANLVIPRHDVNKIKDDTTITQHLPVNFFPHPQAGGYQDRASAKNLFIEPMEKRFGEDPDFVPVLNMMSLGGAIKLRDQATSVINETFKNMGRHGRPNSIDAETSPDHTTYAEHPGDFGETESTIYQIARRLQNASFLLEAKDALVFTPDRPELRFIILDPFAFDAMTGTAGLDYKNLDVNDLLYVKNLMPTLTAIRRPHETLAAAKDSANCYPDPMESAFFKAREVAYIRPALKEKEDLAMITTVHRGEVHKKRRREGRRATEQEKADFAMGRRQHVVAVDIVIAGAPFPIQLKKSSCISNPQMQINWNTVQRWSFLRTHKRLAQTTGIFFSEPPVSAEAKLLMIEAIKETIPIMPEEAPTPKSVRVINNDQEQGAIGDEEFVKSFHEDLSVFKKDPDLTLQKIGEYMSLATTYAVASERASEDTKRHLAHMYIARGNLQSALIRFTLTIREKTQEGGYTFGRKVLITKASSNETIPAFIATIEKTEIDVEERMIRIELRPNKSPNNMAVQQTTEVLQSICGEEARAIRFVSDLALREDQQTTCDIQVLLRDLVKMYGEQMSDTEREEACLYAEKRKIIDEGRKNPQTMLQMSEEDIKRYTIADRDTSKLFLRMSTLLIKLRQPRIILATSASALNLFGDRGALGQQKKSVNVVVMDEASLSPHSELLAIMGTFYNARIRCLGDMYQGAPHCKLRGWDPVKATLTKSVIDVTKESGNVKAARLTTTFRAHPNLTHLAATIAYGTQLRSGVALSERTLWRKICDADMKAPIVFVHIDGRSEKLAGQISLQNAEERGAVEAIVNALMTRGVEKRDMIVTSLYAEQVRQMRIKIKEIDIVTADAVQGMECEIGILSTVNTTEVNENQFLNNKARALVALTRSREGQIIVGHRAALERSEVWRMIIRWIEKHGRVMKLTELIRALTKKE